MPPISLFVLLLLSELVFALSKVTTHKKPSHIHTRTLSDNATFCGALRCFSPQVIRKLKVWISLSVIFVYVLFLHLGRAITIDREE